MKQKRTTGTLCKKQQGEFKKQFLTAEEAQVIQNLIDVDATITLKEIKLQTGYAVSLQYIAWYIQRFSYSIKRISLIAAAADTPSIWEQSRLFALWFLEMKKAGRSIAFTDVVGFQYSARTSRGRSKKGEKCQIVGPCLRCKNIPVMAGLTDSTILHYNVFENNGNALAYAHFSDDAAGARDDANLPENSIIVMDNLPFHRHARVIEIMQIRGWEWRFLPPYSPFLNPIECLFSQWKNHVKRSEPEDLEELDAATREVINVVTADH